MRPSRASYASAIASDPRPLRPLNAPSRATSRRGMAVCRARAVIASSAMLVVRSMKDGKSMAMSWRLFEPESCGASDAEVISVKVTATSQIPM